MTRQMKTQAVGREIIHVAPGLWRQVQTIIGTVHLKFLLCAIFISNDNIKAPAQRYDQLLLVVVCMATSRFATRHIIGPEDSFYFERQNFIVFHEGEITSWVKDLWQVNDGR